MNIDKRAILVASLAMTVMMVIVPTAQADGSRQGTPDPFVFSTFLGGSGADWPHSMAIGEDGSIYVAGYTLSYDFPTTDGAFQRVTKGNEEVYVVKVSPDGSELLWSTLIGGTGQEIAWDMSLGIDGKVYVTGYTTSPDFPTTLDAYSRTRDGDTDGFIVCLSADGGNLSYSTLLGGENDDQGYSIVALDDGRVYVAGHTESVFFPTTSGVHDRGLHGISDVFIARLSDDGSMLERSTYLGGSYTEWEPTMTLGASGDLWVTGSTTSQDFPTTAGLPNDWNFGRDVFVVSMKGDLSALKKATVVGMEGNDVPRSVDLGPDGEVLVAGFTNSVDFPHDQVPPGNENRGRTDGFVMEYSGDLVDINHHKLYGGYLFDAVRRATYDDDGIIHVVGYTNSSNFPTTLGAYKTYKTNDDHDMFYMQVDPLQQLAPINSTLIGKMMGDFGMALALDHWGTAVIAGHTRSPNFPTAGDPYDDTYHSTGDTVVFRFTTDGEPPEIVNVTAPQRVGTGGKFNVTATVTDATAVGSVKMEYWFNEEDPVLVNMTGDGPYNISIDVPVDAIQVHYSVMAWDVLGRLNYTTYIQVIVDDLTPPHLERDMSPLVGTTGDAYGFMMEVVDNRMVAKVQVEHDLDGPITIPLDRDDETPAIWNGSIYLPMNSTDPFEYRVIITDDAGNTITTEWKEVTVRDDDEPFLGILRVPKKAQPGSVITINVTAMDNIGITAARLEHMVELGSAQVIHIEAPFSPFIMVDVPIPDGNGDLHIELVVVDAAGNMALVADVVPFRDDDPPELVLIEVPYNTTTGELCTVLWQAVDPGKVQSMWVYYAFGSVQDPDEYFFSPSQTDAHGTVDIPIPIDSLEPLLVRIGAVDAFGNVNETQPILVEVKDNDAPRADAGDDRTIGKPDIVTLDAGRSTDNIGIVLYVWKWSTPGYDDINIEQTTDPTWTVNVTEVGEYLFRLEVYDAAGLVDTDQVEVRVLGHGDPDDDSDLTPSLALVFLGAVLIVVLILVVRNYVRD
jgi:hypothetical protein